jgi:L-ascorbate metabolism protein UlaG (beta-lactamase superfamily)
MKMLLTWLFSLIVLFIFSSFLVGYLLSGPVYQGPVSENFDGKRFVNVGGVQAKEGLDLFKWFLTRKPGPWEERKNLPYGPPPAVWVPEGELVVTFINHTTFLIQADGMNILTDPVWSERVSPFSFAGPARTRPPGLRMEDLPPIDVILLSHNHYDHMDMATLKTLCKMHEPLLVVPLGVDLIVKKEGLGPVLVLDWWEQGILPGGMEVHAVPAQHFSGRGLFDRDATLWCGYMLNTEQGYLYFAGDTGYGPFFREIGARFQPISLAIIPIGAYKPTWFMAPVHTDPFDAVNIHQEVGAQLSVASHYGTFPLADDSQEDPVKDLREALESSGLPLDVFVTMEEGLPLVVRKAE